MADEEASEHGWRGQAVDFMLCCECDTERRDTSERDCAAASAYDAETTSDWSMDWSADTRQPDSLTVARGLDTVDGLLCM